MCHTETGEFRKVLRDVLEYHVGSNDVHQEKAQQEWIQS